MKKFFFIIAIILCVLTSCKNDTDIVENLEDKTSEVPYFENDTPHIIGNPTPEDVYNKFENVDFFVIEHNVVCVKQADDGWVQNLDFTGAEKVGEIERSEIYKEWQAWDSTILKVGTEIFIHPQRTEAYMALLENGEKIYYCAWLEG